jgi:hypothetical protein
MLKRINLFLWISRILTNLQESLVLYAEQFLKNKAQIWIRKSKSMGLFQIVIDKSNLFWNYPYRGFDS